MCVCVFPLILSPLPLGVYTSNETIQLFLFESQQKCHFVICSHEFHDQHFCFVSLSLLVCDEFFFNYFQTLRRPTDKCMPIQVTSASVSTFDCLCNCTHFLSISTLMYVNSLRFLTFFSRVFFSSKTHKNIDEMYLPEFTFDPSYFGRLRNDLSTFPYTLSHCFGAIIILSSFFLFSILFCYLVLTLQLVFRRVRNDAIVQFKWEPRFSLRMGKMVKMRRSGWLPRIKITK